ncbi:aldo/keto reductase [Aerococcaceae bacterium DSM 111176]|nr:aldo/keto reductase [Aerococcaceae bacterium DSM 111176]
MKDYRLKDGYSIPSIGLGTYTLKGSKGVRLMESALKQGYRLLDSAYNYENEGAVGRAVRNSSVPRDQITITSKLPGRYHRYDLALEAIEESIMRLDVDYIDLYLIHWPNPIKDLYVEAWQALITAQKAGLIRSIGTSNFLPEHIDRLERETGVLPVVNQLELHPLFNQEEVLNYHKEKDIIIEAWSPFGRGDIFGNEILTKLAAKYEVSVAQLIMRWHLQRGILPIPRTSNAGRAGENLNVHHFEINADDMAVISGLSQSDGRLKDQDPAVYQEF